MDIVGLVAAIAQFVAIGIKLANRVADFNAAVDDIPENLKQITAVLPLMNHDLEKLKRKVEVNKISKDTQIALKAVVVGCSDTAARLNVILESVLPAEGASKWSRRLAAVKSLASDRKIDDAASALKEYMNALVFHQVSDIAGSLDLEMTPSSRDPHSQAFWIVPYDRNINFVGRHDIFKALDETLSMKKESQPKAALYRLGGIGKSQIVLEYCHRTRKENGDISVFWVNAATSARFEESFTQITRECDLMNCRDAGTEATALVKSWLEIRHLGPWLMVIDNVDNAHGFFQEKMRCGKTPSECIPRCSRGSLLYTTRSRHVAVDVATPSKPIDVRQMTKSEGIQLVKRRLQQEESDIDIITLLDCLEYIPLAINQAVAFMAKRRKIIQEYVDRYRRDDVAKAMLLSHEFSDHARSESSLESVAKTWMISFESIQSLDPRASQLLFVISFLQNQGIPAQLLQSKEEDCFDFEDSAELLEAYSFINANKKSSTFSTHRLVQVATKLWLRKMMPADVDKWALGALESVNDRFPQSASDYEADYFNQCASLLPHAEAVLQHSFTIESQNIGKTKAILLNSTGRYVYWMESYEEARTKFQQSTDMNLKHLGAKHVNTMESIEQLAWSLVNHNERKEAIPLLEQLVKDRTEIMGENDRQTIEALSDLAVAVALTDDIERSEEIQREALSRSKRFLGPQSLDTTNCMARLANVLSDLGKNIEAETLYRDVFGSYQKYARTYTSKCAHSRIELGSSLIVSMRDAGRSFQNAST
ncbi:kinesin light chain [Colletotrichum kahawae]|uniref:Kinesin light chain n=1 Tax=Colletotrichum kahawae TaxID=34407 RepID=A0AAD9YRU4_COLKA|nr:kinesin light chain [Colletotrichum kahawae]